MLPILRIKKAIEKKNLLYNGNFDRIPNIYAGGLHGVATNVSFDPVNGAVFKGGHDISVADTDAQASRIDYRQGYAIEMIIKTTFVTSDASISEAWNGGGGYMWALRQVTGGYINFNIYNGTAGATVGSSAINDGLPHHLVFVREKSTNMLKVYIDGVLNNSVSGETLTGNIYANSTGFHLGTRLGVGTQEWQGSMKNFRVYRNELNATEVAKLYNGGKGLAFPDIERNLMTPPVVSYPLTSNARNEVLTPIAHTGGGSWVNGTSAGTAVESEAFGWHIANNGVHYTQFDENVKYNGVASIRLSARAVATTYLQVRGGSTTYYEASGQRLLPYTTYKLSCRMKTHYISGDSNNGACVQYITSKADGTFAGIQPLTPYVKTTTDWTYYEFTFDTGAEAVWGHPELRIYAHTGTGTLVMNAWFDEIVVEPIGSMIGVNSFANNLSQIRVQDFPPVFSQLGTYTVTVRFKTDSVASANRQIWNYGASGSDRHCLTLHNSTLGFQRYDGTSYFGIRRTGIVPNKWYTVICECNAGVMRMWVDGIEADVAGTEYAPNGVANTLYFGYCNVTTNGAGSLYGDIQYARVFARTLTEAERNVINSSEGKTIISRAGIAGEWLMTDYVGYTSDYVDISKESSIGERGLLISGRDGRGVVNSATGFPFIKQGNRFTIAMRFKLNGDGDGHLFGSAMNNTDANLAFGYRASSNSIEGAFFTAGSPNVYKGRFRTGTLQLGVWYDLMVRYDGTTLGENTDGVDVFVNGVLQPRVSSNFGSAGGSTLAWGIGCSNSNQNGFNGYISKCIIHNTALTDEEIMRITMGGDHPRATIYREYLLNETSGNTILDTSGNGDNGTFTGWALECINASSYARTSTTVPIGASTIDPNGLTGIVWVKANDYNGGTLFRFNSTNDVDDCLRINVESTTGYLFIWTVDTLGSGTTLPKTDSINYKLPLHTWVKLGITFKYDSGAGTCTGEIYVNGKLILSTVKTRNVRTSGAFKLQGDIAGCQFGNAVVFNRVLSSAEMLANYQNATLPSGCVLDWRLGEGTGTSLTDSSGSGATGTSASHNWKPMRIDDKDAGASGIHSTITNESISI